MRNGPGQSENCMKSAGRIRFLSLNSSKPYQVNGHDCSRPFRVTRRRGHQGRASGEEWLISESRSSEGIVPEVLEQLMLLFQKIWNEDE